MLFRSGGFKRDASGNKIVDANGLFIQAPNTLFGTVLPKFTGGFLNTFTYKGLTGSFNIDFSKGGKYYSLSDHWGEFSGLLERTGGLNDKGIPVREPVADGGGVRVDAVTADGKAYSGYVEGKDYYQQFTNHQIGEGSVFDLGYVKLREVSIGYNIPMAKLGIKQIQGANISLVARNPFLIYAKNRDFDPSEISNIYGENGQLPGTRSLGFNIKLTF